MKKLIYLLTFLTAFSGCKSKQGQSITDINKQKQESGAIRSNKDTNLDSFRDTVSGLIFSGWKTNDGFTLKYQLKTEDSAKTISKKFINQYDVIFPELSIAIFKDTSSYRKQRLYVYADSILIMPLLGVNNYLQFYIINLRSGISYGDDIFSSLSMIWIKERNGLTIYRADTPVENDSVATYKINSFSIARNKISPERSKFIKLNAPMRYDEDKQFKIIKRLN
jgi:hypothetical protein